MVKSLLPKSLSISFTNSTLLGHLPSIYSASLLKVVTSTSLFSPSISDTKAITVPNFAPVDTALGKSSIISSGSALVARSKS